jgi:osmotically-inducible protein OsmY
MMKYFYCALVIAISLSLQSCSSILSATTATPIPEEPQRRTTGSLIDDEIIEIKALVNIDKASPELAQAHINATSYNGILLLTGQVSSEHLRQQAAQTAAKIGSVRQVHNEISVAGTTSMVARSNDTWITTKVKSKLLANGAVVGQHIKVVTENGVVYLMGLVTRDQADRAAEITRKTAGVQKVVRIFEYI